MTVRVDYKYSAIIHRFFCYCLLLLSSLAVISVQEAFSFSTTGLSTTSFRKESRVWAFVSSEYKYGKKYKYIEKSPYREEGIHLQPNFYIRDGQYADLGRVASIIVDSFYTPSIFVRPFLYASELQRLQENFPYNKTCHSYLVACRKNDVEKEVVIGFVDIDARPAKNADAPPRPYLSDLAVDKYYRRLGLASCMIRECEARVIEMGMNRLFLRVERDNNAARKMYDSMGYDQLSHHIFGVKDTTILLKRSFDAIQPDSQAEGTAM